MNLSVDCGNTRIKFGVFNNRELIEHETSDYEDGMRVLTALKEKYSIGQVIISDVSGKLDDWLFSAKDSLIWLDHSVGLPIENNYKTPNTLGNDRIAGVVGGYAKFPGKNVLVIDAGTCITYDFLDAEGKYIGGAISPGIEMRLKAMHTFTGKLPLVSFEKKIPLIGTNTVECIQTGAINGTIAEIEQTIVRYKDAFANLEVVLTGGDLDFLADALKSNIFADSFIVLKGLNEILLYNTH